MSIGDEDYYYYYCCDCSSGRCTKLALLTEKSESIVPIDAFELFPILIICYFLRSFQIEIETHRAIGTKRTSETSGN